MACGGGTTAPGPAPAYMTVIESVPLIIAPRIAAGPDGVAWLAWTEGGPGRESLAAASVDRTGRVSRSALSPELEGAQRDAQIIVRGSTPVVAWRAYTAAGVRVRAAAPVNGVWTDEFDAGASYDGGVHLLPLRDGSASLVWQQGELMGAPALMAARRSAAGVWSSPVRVAGMPLGMVMGAPRQAEAPDRSLALIWTEARRETSSTLEPQVLMMSRLDPASGSWGTPAPVDSDNGPYYYHYDIAATAQSGWMVVWITGTPDRQPALLSKRWAGGAWDTTPARVDLGEDHTLRDLALGASDAEIHITWAGLPEFTSPATLRAARFDGARGVWSAPSLLGSAARGYPQQPRLVSAGSGSAVVAWSVQDEGNAGPFLTSLSTTGRWAAPSVLEPGRDGFAPDLALFEARDLATAWYRYTPLGRLEIVVRRQQIPE